MELRQLEYFVAVAEEANFTKAANKLHVAQPGVSAQIRQLERELGQPLFDRSGRRVRLTKVGAAVLPHARAALDAVAGARLVVDDLAELMLGRVAVGMVTSCPSLDLPDLLADFHHIHPAIEITLSEANSDVLIEDLRDGRLDMAIIGLGTAPATGIETQTIADEALVAAVSLEHPLAGRTTITLQSLKDRPIISLPPGTGLRVSLDEGCAMAGFRPRIAFEASNLNVVPTGPTRPWDSHLTRIGGTNLCRSNPCPHHHAPAATRPTRAGLESRKAAKPGGSCVDQPYLPGIGFGSA